MDSYAFKTFLNVQKGNDTSIKSSTALGGGSITGSIAQLSSN